jgi:hypothetical protein
LNPFGGRDKSEPATPQPTGDSSSGKKTTKSSSDGKKKSPPPFSTRSNSTHSSEKNKKRTPPIGLACNSRGSFFTDQEADELRTDSTNKALESLARSPEFALWLTKNASRIRVMNDEHEE